MKNDNDDDDVAHKAQICTSHKYAINSNAFSLFLKVFRDMAVDCRLCGRVLKVMRLRTINRETAVSIICHRAWISVCI